MLTVRPVRVSFVLRVDADRLASGQLIGEIEEVATGRLGALTSPADVHSFCVDSAAPEVPARPSLLRGDR